tara:strand:- start:50 stop:187 length:138 start_codon:yes stop_codon:yes gene_type:complete
LIADELWSCLGAVDDGTDDFADVSLPTAVEGKEEEDDEDDDTSWK